jgi:uncharacterized cupredoxin-like copper-binding protein
MKNENKILLILALIASSLFIGCVDSVGEVVVVQDRSEMSLDLLKGVVYDVDLWVKNEADVSKSARVTVELLAQNTGEERDSQTKTINLKPGETKQLTFTLDGENGIEYEYSYFVDEL